MSFRKLNTFVKCVLKPVEQEQNFILNESKCAAQRGPVRVNIPVMVKRKSFFPKILEYVRHEKKKIILGEMRFSPFKMKSETRVKREFRCSTAWVKSA